MSNVWSEPFITVGTKGCAMKSSRSKKPKRKTMAVRLDHIWGIVNSSQYPQETQRGMGVLHEDRSANQRLRKLDPLEVVYKLQ